MKNMNKLALAASVVLAVVGFSGCTSMQVAELARADAAPAAEPQVIRATQSYGTMGGYRYRRFVSVAAAS